MASTDRVRRLLNLISILQSGQFINTRELAEQCGVSRRTIFRDIEQLRDSGLRIGFDEKRQGYQFQDSRFLLPADLTTEEVVALITLCQDLADEQSGISHLGPARLAAFKLASVLPQDVRKYVSDSIELHRLQIGAQADLRGTEKHYGLIFQAMLRRKPVQVEYTSYFDGSTIATRVDPYRFYFRQRTWYVIGRSEMHGEIRTFHLKRFASVEILESKNYEIPRRFSLEAYFGNAWNMIREKDQSFHVVVRFARRVAGNVSEILWHKTQRIEQREDGGIDFHVDVEGLSEIIWWILGYGDQAEVIEPPELRDMVIAHAEQMLKTYRGQ